MQFKMKCKSWKWGGMENAFQQQKCRNFNNIVTFGQKKGKQHVKKIQSETLNL